MAEPKLKEFCGLVAVWLPDGDAVPLCHRGLLALQHRGQEAAGIVAVSSDGELHKLRARGLVSDALPVGKLQQVVGSRALGHVRYSTVAIDGPENIQPFVADTRFGRLAIAHNGNLKNAAALTAELLTAGALLATSMDTELLVHLAARSTGQSVVEALRLACARAVGAYSLGLLCDGRLYGLRDGHGLRPLVLGELLAPRGWVLASESCALEAMGARYCREVAPGELIELGPDGPCSTALLPQVVPPSPCVFELVYFARPDSMVFGQSVQAARVRMGEELARQDVRLDGGPPAVDCIVAVPDSGIPAAVGYSRESGLLFEPAIRRSPYPNRTFLLPADDERALGVRLKLSVDRAAVAGRRVLIVDDSLVRGHTARELVAMVRAAGASWVGLRIASPPLRWPCYLGIDTPDRDELIVNRLGSLAAVAAHIGVDELRYLDEAGLRRATLGESFCLACMNGRYPV